MRRPKSTQAWEEGLDRIFCCLVCVLIESNPRKVVSFDPGHVNYILELGGGEKSAVHIHFGFIQTPGGFH